MKSKDLKGAYLINPKESPISPCLCVMVFILDAEISSFCRTGGTTNQTIFP